MYLSNCSLKKQTFICGDRECVNSKEAQKYFQENLIIEVKVKENNKNTDSFNLVYLNTDIDEKNNILITMTLTTPNCPEAETIPDRVAEAVSKCDNVEDVRVEIVWEPTWTQDNMSEAARLELGFF